MKTRNQTELDSLVFGLSEGKLLYEPPDRTDGNMENLLKVLNSPMLPQGVTCEQLAYAVRRHNNRVIINRETKGGNFFLKEGP